MSYFNVEVEDSATHKPHRDTFGTHYRTFLPRP
jgi:hypothetical protein